jgi:hypothetical protein
LRIGDALHLGGELVIFEDPQLVEVLEREDAFLALGARRQRGTVGRLRVRRVRPPSG